MGGHSVWKYRKYRESLDLFSVRKQAHTIESATIALDAARLRHPNAGMKEMMNIIRTETNNMRVSRCVIREWMENTEPDEVQARRGQIARRRVYYSVGSNEIWAIDQHDKWKRLGLWMHVGLDVFSGKVLWLRVWWTNSNPRLICGYYLDAIRQHGGMPLLTHSDPGSENYGVANAQSTLRQMLDPSLQGTMQHRWLRGHSNIKPEIFWSQWRRRAAPALEELMQSGIDNGWYDPHINLEMLVFRFIFMPLVQQELDQFVERYNTSAKRANTKTSLPAGRPKYIYLYPEQYGGEDLKQILVPPEAVDHVRGLYAPLDHPVFKLMPPQFQYHASNFYQQVGGGLIVRENAWWHYWAILDLFRRMYATDGLHQELHLQGSIQNSLQERAEVGSHRGDAWGYDLNMDESMELIKPVPEEGFDFDDNEAPEVDFSDEEGEGAAVNLVF
ncbi:hypothetical protein FRC07_012855 [Ceratobasidium sp. 392]|nr:hypothetical protein FRC07_012855 [Ceratobasidium sp. 392]